MTDEWTPYGLEPIRARALWRRRLLAALLAVLILAALLAVLLTRPAQVVETRISLSGTDSDAIEIELLGQEALLSKPLRVELSPGGITHVGTGFSPDADRLSQASRDYPYIRGEVPYNFLRWLLGWGPLLLLGYLVWAAGRGATNPVAQVNFGIYKGAMPLELITGSYRHLVVTQRLATNPIFGKERDDYVPPGGPRPVPRQASFEPVTRE